MRRYTILLTAITCSMSVMAQNQQTNVQSYQYDDETQLWRLTQNAAGLALDMRDSSSNRGMAFFDLTHRSGDYHRVQEGEQMNQLRFYTERYQKIGKYLYGYGSFDFDMGRTKNRAWSDVMRTYYSNPFISGSSIFGKYDFQNFAMNAKLGSVALGRFTVGTSLYYKVGDLSRLRDPRSRNKLTDYQITPGATYSIGQHTLGLAAFYHRYKEKLTGLTTVQTDPNLKYYVMTGLDRSIGTTGGYKSYWREYVNHEFGGELSYAVKSASLNSLNTLSFSHGTEYAYGIYKYEPGRYYTNKFGFATNNRLVADNMLHSLDVKVNYEKAYADQYNQEEITEKDEIGNETRYWNTTITYKKRYQMKKLDLSAHYRLSFTKDQETTGYVGASYDLRSVRQKELLPVSEMNVSSSVLGLEGGCALLGNQLWIIANVDYKISNKCDGNFYQEASDYAQAVLIPDMAYYNANYWKGSLAVTYQFPLTIKGYKSQWFVKAYGNYLKTNNSMKGQTAGLSFGMYY